MSEAIGFKLLLFLAKNPLAHEIVQEFDITLELANSIQDKHIGLWQEMLKVKPKTEIVYHTIDVGYRAVRLNIPREWDEFARRCILAIDAPEFIPETWKDLGDGRWKLIPSNWITGGYKAWHTSWVALWDGICHIIWRTNLNVFREKSKAKVKPSKPVVGVMKYKYPLVNGKTQDFKPRYRWCRGCIKKRCIYHS